jgi:DNA-binding transcriptional ArsR family regulator
MPKSPPSASIIGVRRMCGRMIFSVAVIRSGSIWVSGMGIVFLGAERGGHNSRNRYVRKSCAFLAPFRVLLYLGSWLIVYMNLEPALAALSSARRLQILAWLKNPRAHFPPQVYGDLVKDGVCGVFIARKMRVSQPTASEHLKILQQAGLVRAKRIKQWTFYRRNEVQIEKIKRLFSATI